MTEPRTRTAAEVADHASALLDEIDRPIYSAFKISDVIQRLASQVEDLAAVVTDHEEALASRPSISEPAPFPPVEWPLIIKCDCDPDRDELVVKDHPGYFLFTAQSKVEAGRYVNLIVDNSDARLLAQAILDRLDGPK